jgi:hypothetical protein
MGIDFESPDLRRLAHDLDEAARIAPVEARKVVAKGSHNIKTDAQRRVTGLAHAPAYPRSITYDTHPTPTGAWGEIGPDKDKRQGALGNIIECGTVKNPPRPHMAPAGDAEEPRFVRAMQDLAVKASGLE